MQPIATCGCHLGALRPFGRRRLMALLGAAGAGLVLPRDGRSEIEYDAMVLSCIDPRFITPTYKYLHDQGLAGRYSQFCIAGAAVAVVAPKFQAWRPAFWDNTETTYQLHRINKIIAIDHRDCGAARIAYGAEAIATPAAETQTHKRALGAFRAAVAQHHPQLAVVTGLMALDGSIELFT